MADTRILANSYDLGNDIETSTTNSILCPVDCKYIHPPEEQPISIRGVTGHVCTNYDTKIYHNGHHPRIEKCPECLNNPLPKQNKPRFGQWIKCLNKEAKEKCGHYSGGICDLAEWIENWESDPCSNAEWPLKEFTRYTALIEAKNNE